MAVFRPLDKLDVFELRSRLFQEPLYQVGWYAESFGPRSPAKISVKRSAHFCSTPIASAKGR